MKKEAESWLSNLKAWENRVTFYWWNTGWCDKWYPLATTCHTTQYFEGYIASGLLFPALRSLAVFCHEDILLIMTIPALNSFILRDFDVCPAGVRLPRIPRYSLLQWSRWSVSRHKMVCLCYEPRYFQCRQHVGLGPAWNPLIHRGQF